MDHGIDYFTYILTEWKPWCGPCVVNYGQTAPACRYCTPYEDEQVYFNFSEPCPPGTSLRASNKEFPSRQTTYWTFQNEDKENQFYVDALPETDIPGGRMYIGRYNYQIDKEGCYDYPRCFQYGWEIDVPMISSGYSVDDVADPKDTISDYLGKTGDLCNGLEIAIVSQLVSSSQSWTSDDMIDAVSVPILMIHQAITSMQEIVDTAGEIDKENRKRQILLFQSAFLFLIPVGGEVIGAISGLASVGRFIALLGEATMVGLDIYIVVDDPSSAPCLIFGYILSAGALADAVKVSKAAKARLAMGESDLAKLGKEFGTGWPRSRR